MREIKQKTFKSRARRLPSLTRIIDNSLFGAPFLFAPLLTSTQPQEAGLKFSEVNMYCHQCKKDTEFDIDELGVCLECGHVIDEIEIADMLELEYQDRLSDLAKEL